MTPLFCTTLFAPWASQSSRVHIAAKALPRTAALTGALASALMLGAHASNKTPATPSARPLAESCASFVPHRLPVNAKFVKTELRPAQTFGIMG